MAQVKDLLVQGQAKFLRKAYFQDQIVSNVAQGTAPLVVASSTVVSNLNSDYLNGYHASGLFTALSANSTLSITIGGTTLTSSINAATVDGKYISNYYTKSEADDRFVNVTGDTMTGPLYIENNKSSGWAELTLKSKNSGSGAGIDYYHANQTSVFWRQGAASDDRFFLARTENGTETVFLSTTSDGKLGIGTTSPSSKLHVVGDIYTTTGFKKNGSSDSYVLLGGGGHKLESSLSVASAACAEYLRTPKAVTGRLSSLNNLSKGGISLNSGNTMMRIDLVTSSISDSSAPPASKVDSSGYLMSFLWDSYGEFSSAAASQIYIPNGDHITTTSGEQTLMYRGNDEGTWTSWYKLVSSKTGSVGNSTQPVYIDSNGFAIAATSYANASVNYANSAGNADTLDGYHEYSFLRYRDVTSTNGTSTLWSQIGIRSYHNALPEGLSGLYNYGQVVSLPGDGSRLDIFTNHVGSSESNGAGGLWWRSGWGDDKHPWRRIIDSGNITNYYWANVNISSSSNVYTTPQFGKVTIYDGTNSRLVLKTASSGEYAYLAAYNSGGSYGADVVLHSGSAMILGAGESAEAMYSNNVDSLQGSENLYLTADGDVKIFTNCDSISNRKNNITFKSNGSIVIYGSIDALDSNGIICYKPSSWTGVSSSQLGIGTVATQTVIRSSNTNLLHYKHGSGTYTILDSNNYIEYTVKKDGTGASGTWGINITGKASTATQLTYKDFNFTSGTKVGDYAKATTCSYNAGTFFSTSGWAWANSSNLDVGGYSVDRMRYSAVVYRNGNLNSTWAQHAIMFIPTYSDSNMIYLAQMCTTETTNVITSVKRYLDYDSTYSNIYNALVNGYASSAGNADTVDNKHASDFVLSTDFSSKELTSNLITISKTLTVTKEWMDTGIKYTDLTTGTYVVQVSSYTTDNLIWDGYWSGIMTWFGGATNASEADEILLHRGAHAYNGNTIYLRTINTVVQDGRHMRLQIAANKNFYSATYTFKFKKII